MKKGTVYYGGDISDKMIDKAMNDFKENDLLRSNDYCDIIATKEKINVEKDNAEIKQKAKGKVIKFLVQDSENLLFEDAQFDVYLSNLCLQLVNNPENALKEAHRVLKKGGVLSVSVWGKRENSYHFHGIETIFKKNGVTFPPSRSNYKISEDLEEMKGLFERCGFSGLKYEYVPILLKVFNLEQYQDHIFTPKMKSIFSGLNEETKNNIIKDIKEYVASKIDNTTEFAALNSLVIVAFKK